MPKWKLVDQGTGAEINIGDERTTFRGELVKLASLQPPQKPNSTGKVYVTFGDGTTSVGNYPGVIKAKFVPATVDLTVISQGNVFILRALTEAGKRWVVDHIPEDAQTWGKGGFVVEQRLLPNIVQAAMGDGLVVT